MTEAPKTHGSAAVGYGLAVLQAAFYSMLGIFGKLLYATGLDSQEAVLLRFYCATILTGAFLLVWRKQPLFSRRPAVYVQSLLFLLSATTFFLAVKHLSAGMTTVLFFTHPAIIAVASVFVFKEKLTGTTVLALLLAGAGLLLVSGVATGGLILDPTGIALGMLASLSWACYAMFVQKIGRTEGQFTVTFTISAVSLAVGCLIFAPSAPTLLHLTLEQFLLGCAMALMCTIVVIVIYIEAVARIGSTKTSLAGTSETPFSLILAFLILGETITPMQGVGTALITLSILVISLAPVLAERKKRQVE